MKKKKSFNSIYQHERGVSYHRDLLTKHEMLTTEQVDFEGRPVSQSKYIVDDPSTRYDGLKASDFALENQIAVGVEFRPVKCSLQTPNEIIGQIEKANSQNYE